MPARPVLGCLGTEACVSCPPCIANATTYLQPNSAAVPGWCPISVSDGGALCRGQSSRVASPFRVLCHKGRLSTSQVAPLHFTTVGGQRLHAKRIPHGNAVRGHVARQCVDYDHFNVFSDFLLGSCIPRMRQQTVVYSALQMMHMQPRQICPLTTASSLLLR